MLESLFNKVARLRARNFIEKETPTQIFSYEISEIFKNTYFEEHMWTTASDNLGSVSHRISSKGI